MIILIILSFMLIFFNDSFADPVVNSVTGTTIYIISGTGFGIKNPAEPYFFDNFESGTHGSYLDGNTGTVGTATWVDPSPVVITYSSNLSYSGSMSAYKQSDGDDFETAGIDGLNSNEVFLSYVWRASASSTNYESDTFKLSRITAPGGWYLTDPSTKFQIQYNNNRAYYGWDDCNNSNTSYDIPIPSLREWHRQTQYAKLNTPGVADGILDYTVDEVNRWFLTNVTWSTADCINDKFDSFILPFDIANNPTNTWTFYADDVYFDITQARVEICNTSSWSTRTHCEIQLPTAWSNTSVTVTVNKGAFRDGDTAYLYVVDSNGVQNAVGFEITIGSDSPAGHKKSSPASFSGVIR